MRKNFVLLYEVYYYYYGCATWTMNEQDKKKLDAMEMWTWRK